MNDTLLKAVKIIEKYKINALLHTTIISNPYNLIRLNSLDQLKKFPRAIIGLSDHTCDNYTSYAAITKGARLLRNILLIVTPEKV